MCGAPPLLLPCWCGGLGFWYHPTAEELGRGVQRFSVDFSRNFQPSPRLWMPEVLKSRLGLCLTEAGPTSRWIPAGFRGSVCVAHPSPPWHLLIRLTCLQEHACSLQVLEFLCLAQLFLFLLEICSQSNTRMLSSLHRAEKTARTPYLEGRWQSVSPPCSPAAHSPAPAGGRFTHTAPLQNVCSSAGEHKGLSPGPLLES